MHENMDKMNDQEFGRALKLVSFYIINTYFRLVKVCKENLWVRQPSGNHLRSKI